VVVAGLVAVEALGFVLALAGGSVVAFTLVVVFVFGAVNAVPVKYVRISWGPVLVCVLASHTL
jgi:hypothetical protein